MATERGSGSKAVGKLLRFRRERAGLTLREVEDRLDRLGDPLSAATLSHIERGARGPGARRLDLLMRLFEIPPELVDDLLELESKGVEIPEPTDFETMVARAHAAWTDGDPDEGMAWFLALQHLCRDGDPRSERMQKTVLYFAQGIGRSGRMELARRILDHVFAVGVHPELRTIAYVLASQTWLHSGNLDVSAVYLERAVEATRPDDREAYAWTMHQRAHLEVLQGRPEEAERSLDHALRHYARTKRARSSLTARLLRVRILRTAGRTGDALRQARAVVRGARRHGFERLEISAGIQVARVLAESGRAAEALDPLHDLLARATRRKYDAQVFDAHANLWRAYRALGDRDRARAALERAALQADLLEFGEPEIVEIREALRALQRADAAREE